MSDTLATAKFFKEHQILQLFQFIESNNDIIIEKSELDNALKKFCIENSYFEGIYSKIDYDKKKVIDYKHFKNYELEQEEKLLYLYKKLDRNQDGIFTLRIYKKHQKNTFHNDDKF